MMRPHAADTELHRQMLRRPYRLVALLDTLAQPDAADHMPDPALQLSVLFHENTTPDFDTPTGLMDLIQTPARP